jgi:hypothetical protein
MGPVIDHYSTLLIQYAELADNEIHTNPFKAKQHGIDLSSMSDNQKLENAISLMENLFRTINQANQSNEATLYPNLSLCRYKPGCRHEKTRCELLSTADHQSAVRTEQVQVVRSLLPAL